MDAFDELMKKSRRRQKRKHTALFIVVPVITLLILCATLFYINDTSVDVFLIGDQDIILEYGQQYQEPGAKAVFSGVFYPGEDRNLEVTTEGSVDVEVVGSYVITYSANERIWSDAQTRNVHVIDTEAPEILLHTIEGAYTLPGRAYIEEGFTAVDNYDGDITHLVEKFEKDGIVTYRVEDSSGNRTEVTREIHYEDPIPPVLMMLGEGMMTIEAGEEFIDPGCTAMDNGQDISEQVTVSGSVNIYRAGTYRLDYYVEDSFGNSACATRTVEVTPCPPTKEIMPEGKVIYLTFDDGPSPYTATLLEVLEKYNVKATFFVCNTDCVEYLEDIAAGGHSIGIHTMSHNYKSIYSGEEAYFSDLFKMQDIIESKTGIKTTLVRFPGGSSNTVSSFNKGIMTRLAKELTDMGFKYFDWNVDSDDAGKTRTAKKVFKNVTDGVQQQDVSIVLQHDVKSYSVEAVEQIICWGLENGYTFMALDETSPTFHHEIRN